jgi:hypothetical protein
MQIGTVKQLVLYQRPIRTEEGTYMKKRKKRSYGKIDQYQAARTADILLFAVVITGLLATVLPK